LIKGGVTKSWRWCLCFSPS